MSGTDRIESGVDVFLSPCERAPEQTRPDQTRPGQARAERAHQPHAYAE